MGKNRFNSRWRIWFYSLLTQTILLLGKLREWLMEGGWEQVRKDRCFDVYETEFWSCCDCGLVHSFQAFSEGQACEHKQPGWVGELRVIGHTWPVRPSDYKYRMRWLAAKPALAEDEE